MGRAGVLLAGVLVAGLAAGGVVWLHARNTGPVLYTIPLGMVSPAAYSTQAYRGALAFDARTGHAAVATLGGVEIVDARRGKVLRTVPINQGLVLTLATEERSSRFIVVSAGGTTVLDTRSGAVLHTVAAELFPISSVVDERDGHAFVLNGRAYGGQVTMLDTRSGQVLRTTVVSSRDAALGIGGLAVDARSGHVFVISPDDDRVRVLDARTGALLRTVQLTLEPTVAAIAVDARAGRVFVVNAGGIDPVLSGVFLGPGTLYVLDARTGTLLRTLPVGIGPIAVATDEQTGHVVVLNTGGAVRVTDTWGWMRSWLRSRLPFVPPLQNTRMMPSSVSVLDVTR